MKKTLLLLGLTAIVAVPSTGSAKMPLDMPPILATGGSPTPVCNECNACDPACTNPCIPCANGCCGTTCKTVANNCAYCCDGGTCSTDVCPTPQTEWGNDTGITVCPANTVALDEDCDFGRDADPNKNSPTDGHEGFSFTKLDSSGNPTTGTAVCIKDNVTGLTWSPDQDDAVLWSGTDGIITTANNSSLCGMTGWRLPTVRELVSIVSYHTTAPAIDTGVFLDTPANGIYWTSTHNAATPVLGELNSMQWAVNFQSGIADNLSLTDNLTLRRVRLVRP